MTVWVLAFLLCVAPVGAVSGNSGPGAEDGRLSEAEVHNNNGVGLAAQGRFKEAIREFRQAIDRNPLFAVAHFNLGQAYEHLKQTEEAAVWFGNAVRIVPEYADAWYRLGAARQKLGDAPGAADALMHAAALLPTDPNVRFRLGLAYWTMRDWRGVVGQWEPLVSESPGHQTSPRVWDELPRAYFNLGTTYQAAGQADSAKMAYKEALRLNPDIVDAGRNLGVLLLRSGDTGEAIEVFEAAIDRNDADPDLVSVLADVYRDVGSLDSAAKTLARLPEGSPLRHAGMARVELARGNREAALKQALFAVKLGPEDVGALAVLAFVYEHDRHGKRYGGGSFPRKALEIYRRALALDPDSAMLHFNAAVLYGRLRQWKDSVEHFERTLELEPDHAGAKRWIGAARKNLEG